jgi:hypothetical protein
VYNVYARNDSIFYAKGGTETFVATSSAGGSGTDSASYHTLTQLSDSSFKLSRPNGTSDTVAFATNQNIGTIGDSENGLGSVITSGSKGFITIPYNCTITNWYITSNLSGTIQFDLKRSGTSIIGSGNKPALSTALSANAAVSGWTSIIISAGDILEWVVDASPVPAVLTQCVVVLKIIK